MGRAKENDMLIEQKEPQQSYPEIAWLIHWLVVWNMNFT